MHLLRDQELSVSSIQEMLDLPQANLSQHLMTLRDAHIVNTRREGKQVYYSLAHKNFIKASDLMREILIERHRNTPLADEFTKKMKDLVPLTQDPVCGMRLSPRTAAYVYKKNGDTVYFCAAGCRDEYKAHPEQYKSHNHES